MWHYSMSEYLQLLHVSECYCFVFVFFSNLIQLILMPRSSQLVKVLLTQVKKEVEEDEPKWKHKLSKCDPNQTQLADKAVTGLINLPPPPVKEPLQTSETRPVSLGGQYVKALYVTVKLKTSTNASGWKWAAACLWLCTSHKDEDRLWKRHQTLSPNWLSNISVIDGKSVL